MVPGKVVLEGKVVQVTDDGVVHLWGCFRVSGDMWKDSDANFLKLERKESRTKLDNFGLFKSTPTLLPPYVSPSLEEMP